MDKQVKPLLAVQVIALDCKPGNPRPGDLIAGVIAGLGLPSRPPASKLFGEWTWDYNDIDPIVWKKAQPMLKVRITNLYNQGLIRYGEW